MMVITRHKKHHINTVETARPKLYMPRAKNTLTRLRGDLYASRSNFEVN